MDRDGVEVHKLAKKKKQKKKKKRSQYPAILTEKAWSIKYLLFGFRGHFSRRTRWVVHSGQDILLINLVRSVITGKSQTEALMY